MTTEIVMPALEMAQDSGKLVRWLKAEGDTVRKGEPLMEVETDKVTVEIEAPAAGILSSLSARDGDEVPVGRTIALLVSESELAVARPSAIAASPVARRIAAEHKLDLGQLANGAGRIEKADVLEYLKARDAGSETVVRLIPASPKARRLALDHGLELTALSGSGPDGAVLVSDVQAVLRRQKADVLAAAASDEYRVVPISGMRRVIAERMQASAQVPQIALTSSADMTEVLRLVEKLKPAILTETGHRLTLSAVLAKAIGAALLRHPRLNAHVVGPEIREFAAVHLGIAVALDDGLIVPVVQQVERKGLAALQTELVDLTGRARIGKLKAGEIKGSTFTLSNLGMFGVEHFTAILNPPEVGILAVGAIQERAVGVDGQLALRPFMQMTLCVDHRAVDGAVGAAFLKTLKETLENPYLLMV